MLLRLPHGGLLRRDQSRSISMQTFVALAIAVGGGAVWLRTERRSRHTYKADRVLEELEKPFVPRTVPKFGPVFPREEFTKDLKEMLLASEFIVYHGSSSRGKSVAIQEATRGRPGVVYMSLRDSPLDDVALASRFAAAIGYPAGQGSLDLEEVFGGYKSATEMFKAKHRLRSVLLLDDYHKFLGQHGLSFLARIVDLFNNGTINVVHSISDYQAVSTMRKVSGHSSRMNSRLFPAMPDEALVKNLVGLAAEMDTQKIKNRSAPIITIEGRLEQAELPSSLPLKLRVEEAQHIVERLGDHMGSIVSCLESVVTRRMSPRDATTAVVAQVDATLAPALMGDVVARTVEGADKPAVDKAPFVATAFSLLEELSRDGVEQADWGVVYNAVPNITPDQLLASVHHLVEKNIISFVDPVTVCLHERRIKWAFLEKWRDNPHVQRAWKDAKKSYGD